MKKQQIVQVFRIEYEILPKMDHYTVYIGALSHEESIQHLRRVMSGKQIQIMSSGLQCPLHELTTGVRMILSGKSAPAPVKKKLSK